MESIPNTVYFIWDGFLGHEFDKKNSSLLLHAIPSLFYWGASQGLTLRWFYNSVQKKGYSWISFWRTEKQGEKTRQKLESGENQVYAQKPRLKLPFKNQSWALAHFFEVRYQLPTQFFPLDRWRSCVHFLNFPFRSSLKRSSLNQWFAERKRTKPLIALYGKIM